MITESNIVIINLEKVNFENHETGEVRNMTKIVYAIKMSNTDRIKGNAVLECYSSEKAFDLLDKKILVPARAKIENVLIKNGAKYKLISVDDINLK